MALRRVINRIWDLFGYDAEFWRGPLLLGAVLALLTWLVWYFTKVPCTADNALKGLCNPGIVASFINVDIMSRCTAAWLGATTLTGGINAIMLNRERQRTEEAQQQLVEERKRFDEERKEERQRHDERIEALINQANEERRQAAEERQVMMATIAELTSAIAELRRQNGNGEANGQP